MKICIVAEGYPTNKDPFFSFVRELVKQFAQKGHKCTVIAPQSVTRAIAHKMPLRPYKWKDAVEKDVEIEIVQPYYLTFSGNSGKENHVRFLRAAKKAFKHKKTRFDCIYGHFWHSGVVAEQISEGIPVFVACGESKISVRSIYSDEMIDHLKERLAGVIYVSTKSYEEAKQLELQNEDMGYIIAPNGFNKEEIVKIPKGEARKNIGAPENAFIVCFVGALIDRKGSKRLSVALERLNKKYKNIYSIFIGKGPDVPDCSHVLFCGSLPHNKISTYLCAADVFALPTTNEGCCNAIVEAIGCGLPIISSVQSFNDDLLDLTNSIRIDPMSVDEIEDALEELYNNREMLGQMVNGSVRKADELSIEKRAERILAFIGDRIDKKN